jgi:hypothetical protein
MRRHGRHQDKKILEPLMRAEHRNQRGKRIAWMGCGFLALVDGAHRVDVDSLSSATANERHLRRHRDRRDRQEAKAARIT